MQIRFRGGVGLCVAFLAILTCLANAGVTVSQNSTTTFSSGALVVTALLPPNTSDNNTAFVPEGTWTIGPAQTFVPSTNLVLTNMQVLTSGGTATFKLWLFDLGSDPGNHLPNPYLTNGLTNLFISNLQFTHTATASTGMVNLAFSALDTPQLYLGHKYAFELTPVSGSGMNWFRNATPDWYTGGDAYRDRGVIQGGTGARDFALAVSGTPNTNTPPPPGPIPPGFCTVDWNDAHQRIDGFGASSAWRSTWTNHEGDMFFSTNTGTASTTNGGSFSYTGIGLSLLRNHIRTNDNVSTVETNLMLQAQARGARVWSAPWTPPAKYKSNTNFVGGTLLASNYLAYSRTMAAYIANMQNIWGINLYALSVQNEPNAVVSYESCTWNSQQIHDFMTNLAPVLVASNMTSTRVMIAEDQNWTLGLTSASMSDLTTSNAVGILAAHGYGSSPTNVNNQGKPLWETEVATLNGGYDGSINESMTWAASIYGYLTVPQVNAWHYWWLISGNGDNEGLAASDGTPAKRMYVLGQFSRFVRPGYYRIGVVNTNATLITAFAYTNSGNFAIVAINGNSGVVTQTFTLTNFSAPASVTPWVTSTNLSLAPQTSVPVSSSSFTYALPGMSVVTFVSATNLPPTDIALPKSWVPENQSSGTTVGSFVTLDPDPGNTFTYALVSGAGSTDNASFSLTGAALKTAASFNYETKNVYNIRVRSTDQDGLFVEKAMTVTVTDVNEAPTDIGLSNSSVGENQSVGAAVGTFSTTDPDAGNTFTYSFTSNGVANDNSSFAIVGNNLQTAATFDYELKTSYTIRVRSADQGGLFFDKNFTINVTNVNEAPTDILLSNASISEGQPPGAAAGNFSATDPDAGNTFTYGLVAGTGSSGNGSFSISGNTLQSAVTFDYSVQNSYSVRVRSTDQGGLFVEKAFVIGVTQVFPPPTLAFAVQGGNIVLSWPDDGSGFQLHSASNLTSTSWPLASPGPVPIGGQLVVTNAMTNPATFYRLQNP